MNEYVQNKVTPPGTALAAFGGISIVLNLLGAIFQIVGAISVVGGLLSSDAGTDAWVQFFIQQGWLTVSSTIAFFVSFVILMAGLRLRQARSPGLVYAGSIFAMLPCCSSWCCCLGLPLGIWAIMTMQDDQVKAAFAEV